MHFKLKFFFSQGLESIWSSFHYYLPPADRPGTGDYKMPSVRATVCHVFTKAFLSLKML